MEQLLENKNDLLKSLIEKGNIRKEKFSEVFPYLDSKFKEYLTNE
jgi:hypothetical protein